MDTQIEHKKRFTPKQIYGGVGVVLLIVLIPVSYTHLDVYKRQCQSNRK